ncbi:MULTISPECIES: hypothetical protein [unclassified Bradyrhizobium]|uniref:hypothetical protein n=1 Tax=unclassified Bradyrhizobium TaxID=2631580 RepID=UPI0028F10A9F|nr:MULTISPECIES: hypothetical protein [unclassified Bradyrhizobium]
MLWHLFWTVTGAALACSGLWIAALFVPSAAIVLKAALDFLRAPIGQILAGLAAFLLWSGFIYAEGDVHGANATRAEWRAADAAAEAAAHKRDALIKAAVASATDRAVADIAASDKSLDQKVEQYGKANSGRPECRATADDIRRLLSIR